LWKLLEKRYLSGLRVDTNIISSSKYNENIILRHMKVEDKEVLKDVVNMIENFFNPSKNNNTILNPNDHNEIRL
jgi:hypothetical protein